MTVRTIESTEKRIRLLFPEALTAAHWQRYHEAIAKHSISGLPAYLILNAALYPAFMATLTLLESGTYEDADGKTHDIKAEGTAVPGYVMVFVAEEGQKRLNESLEVPKFSSAPPPP